MKLGEAMYKAQQETAAAPEGEDNGGNGAAGTEQPADEAPVVDADFEEVEEEKKNKSAWLK